MKPSRDFARLALLSWLFTLCLTMPYVAQAQYAITDLGTLGGSESWGCGINNSGQVVGASHVLGNESQHAFLYDGVMHDLLGISSQASGINDAGVVVGSSGNAYLYNGVMHDLGTLGGNSSCAYAINNAGQVVGMADTSSPNFGSSG